VRDARYVRLISWTLWCGSEHSKYVCEFYSLGEILDLWFSFKKLFRKINSTWGLYSRIIKILANLFQKSGVVSEIESRFSNTEVMFFQMHTKNGCFYFWRFRYFRPWQRKCISGSFLKGTVQRDLYFVFKYTDRPRPVYEPLLIQKFSKTPPGYNKDDLHAVQEKPFRKNYIIRKFF
jgi:hypothetical protein